MRHFALPASDAFFCGYDLRGTELGGLYITCPECGNMQARIHTRDDDTDA